VIDVSVRKNDGVDGGGAEGRMLLRFLASSLRP